jgi:GNAT superfamily N-acetyltransferase
LRISGADDFNVAPGSSDPGAFFSPVASGFSRKDVSDAARVGARRMSLVIYALFTESDTSDMARLLGQVFSRRDPPAVAVGLSGAEFEEFVQLFCPKAAAEELTIIARSAATGDMIGALLAEDSSSAPPETLSQVSTKFNPIFDILGQLDAEYREGRPPVQRGEWIHLFLLGVADDFLGKGLAQQLVAACLENGVRKGYRLAVTEATNKISQHVFRKQGFSERVKRSYTDHVFDGHAFFRSIADQGGPILMDKELAQLERSFQPKSGESR